VAGRLKLWRQEVRKRGICGDLGAAGGTRENRKTQALQTEGKGGIGAFSRAKIRLSRGGFVGKGRAAEEENGCQSVRLRSVARGGM